MFKSPLAWPWAVLAGLAQALSMGLPFHAGPSAMLQMCSMLVLAQGLCTQSSAKRAFQWGWIFQTTAFIGTFWWIFISLHVYGEMPAALAAAGVGALSALLALYWSLMAACFHLLFNQAGKTRFQIFRASTLFAACWMLAELARAQWFTGFPWGSSGYAHTLGTLSVLAPWVGVYGIGAFSAGLSMAWVLAWAKLRASAHSERKSRVLVQTLCAALSLLVLCLALVPLRQGGVVPSEDSERASALKIALLQGNVAQESKFSAAQRQASQWYTQGLLTQDADLVITPETAFGEVAQSKPTSFWQALMEHSKNTQTALLLGIPVNDARGFTNSALGVAPNQTVLYRYDKAHLVPFGEFLPPLFKWFTDQMKMPLGFFRSGEELQDSMLVGKERIAPNICYEDLFGEELAKRFVQPKLSPTLLVNMSNIAWFGDTVVVDQHLEISRMRSLELERPMIRATNSGATAVIDERGILRARLNNFEQGVLHFEVHGVEHKPTAFAWWAGHFGLWPLWILGLCALLLEALLCIISQGRSKI